MRDVRHSFYYNEDKEKQKILTFKMLKLANVLHYCLITDDYLAVMKLLIDSHCQVKRVMKILP